MFALCYPSQQKSAGRWAVTADINGPNDSSVQGSFADLALLTRPPLCQLYTANRSWSLLSAAGDTWCKQRVKATHYMPRRLHRLQPPCRCHRELTKGHQSHIMLGFMVKIWHLKSFLSIISKELQWCKIGLNEAMTNLCTYNTMFIIT